MLKVLNFKRFDVDKLNWRTRHFFTSVTFARENTFAKRLFCTKYALKEVRTCVNYVLNTRKVRTKSQNKQNKFNLICAHFVDALHALDEFVLWAGAYIFKSVLCPKITSCTSDPVCKTVPCAKIMLVQKGRRSKRPLRSWKSNIHLQNWCSFVTMR